MNAGSTSVSMDEHRVFLPPHAFVGWELGNALTRERCATLLDDVVARGFVMTGMRYPADYRDNDRLVFDDAALADELFALLRDRLPVELVEDGAHWQLCGFNPRFRACRYTGGQGFCIHRDGPHVPSDDVRSFLTVQLYLDDDPSRVGGRTRFYADARGDTRWASIAPARGTAIVFDHRAWHDGEPVSAGEKHVLRTDAMYRRIASDDAPLHRGAMDAPDARTRDGVTYDAPGTTATSPSTVVGRHRGYAWRAIVLANGTVASAGRDGTLRRWRDEAEVIDLARGSITTVFEASDHTLWCGTRAGQLLVGSRVAHDGDAAVLSLAARRDRVFAATAAGDIHTFALDGEHLATTRAHTGWAWSVVAHGEGVVSCGHDGRVTRDGRELAVLGSPLRAVAVLRADARAISDAMFVVGDTRGWLHYLARDGRVIASVRAHTAAITSLAVRGDIVASGSEDGAVTRWRGGRALSTTRITDFVTSVAFAGDDIIVAGYDGAIRRV